MDDLEKRNAKGVLARRHKFYAHPDLLTIDEVGYMQLTRQQVKTVCQVICSRHEWGSVIITSNKYFSDGGELMSGLSDSNSRFGQIIVPCTCGEH